MGRSSLACRALAVGLAVVALAGCDVRRFVSGWAPYWTPSGSAESYGANSELFEAVSPFWYSAQGDAGTIVAKASTASMATLVDQARADGVPVLPSITDGFGAGGMAAVLADPVTRAEHVAAIVDLVRDGGFDGIDLDYEGFAFADGRDTWPTTQPNWVAFVRSLARALHADGKLLSVTVPPIWANGTRGYTVYAWEEIGPAVDRLRVMNYDWSYSVAGPGSPIWWVHDTLDYAATVVPMGKVEIGVPAYGREWTVRTRGTCPPEQLPSTQSHTLENIPALIAAVKATPTRDESSGEMTFRYRETIATRAATNESSRPMTQRELVDAVNGVDTIDGPVKPGTRPSRLSHCRITREVWYPDATAIAQRARAAVDAGARTSIWALGYETPDVWDALGAVGATIDGPNGTDPVGEVEAVTSTGRRVRASGWAFDPEGTLPIAVTISVWPATDLEGSPLVTRTVLAGAPRDDVATDHPGAGSFHGFDAVVRLGSGPAGDHRVCVTASGRYAGAAETDLGCTTVTVS